MPKIPPVKVTIQKITEKNVQAVVHNVRLAFVHLVKPAVFEDSIEYSVSALIPKKEIDLVKKKIQKAVEECMEENTELDDQKKEVALEIAFDDGEEGAIFKDGDKNFKKNSDEVYEGFEDAFYIKAKCKGEALDGGGHKPRFDFSIVNNRGKAIPKDELDTEIYSGIYADLAINLSPYPGVGRRGNPGVTCYLAGVMKLADADRLGSFNPFTETREDMDAFNGSDEDDDKHAKGGKAGKGRDRFKDDEEEEEEEQKPSRPSRRSEPEKPKAKDTKGKDTKGKNSKDTKPAPKKKGKKF